MKCEKHPEMDAVGNCVYCGRGVCDECKVRMNDLVHCRECVVAGRIKGGQPVQGPKPGQMGPITIPFPMRHMPRPKGPPKPYLFKLGGIGAILSGTLMIVMGSSIFFSGYDHPFPGGVKSVVFIMVTSVLGLFIVCTGCYGIYWNYGSRSGMVGIIAMLILGPFVLFVISIMIGNNQDEYSLPSWLMYSGPMAFMYAVMLTLMHFFLAYSRHYIPVWHGARKVMVAARAASIVGVGFLYTVNLLPFVGFIVAGVAYILFSIFFFTAPMPDDKIYLMFKSIGPSPGPLPPIMGPPAQGQATGRTL